MKYINLKLFAIFLLPSLSLLAQDRIQIFDRDDEKELKVKLEYGAGVVSVRKVESDKLCIVKMNRTKKEIATEVRYLKRGTTGYLDIELTDDMSYSMFDVEDQKLDIELTDKIPCSVNMEMGACSGRLDFSGIRLQDLALSMGASSAEIEFNTPNKDRIRKLKVEAGVSKLKMRGLANANFERMEFEGGVGSYVLDFSGNLKENSECRISLGLGKLVVRIPRNLNVRIHSDESFLASFKIDRKEFVRKNDTYYNVDYDDSRPHMEMWIETGLGNLKVQTIE